VEVYKVVSENYNGYWCSCCKHIDYVQDVRFETLNDLLGEFPKSLEDWKKNFDRGYGLIKVEIFDPDENLKASWEVHIDSYKTKMSKLSYFKKKIGDKEEIEVFLGDNVFSGTVEEADLVRRRVYYQEELTAKFAEIISLKSKIDEITSKLDAMGSTHAPFVNP